MISRIFRLLPLLLLCFGQSDIQAQWTWSEIGDGTKPTIASDGTNIHIAALKESQVDGYLVYFTEAVDGFVADTVRDDYYYGPIDIITDQDGMPLIAVHSHLVGSATDRRGDLVLASINQNGNWTFDATDDVGHDGWDGTMVMDSEGVIHTVIRN